jgi:hypothetical protein
VNPRNKELLIFGFLFFVGLVVLPVCIYIVGVNVIGEYSPEAGMSGLLLAIWGDVARLRISAWILVLSPWVVIQLVRLALRLWRGSHGSPDPAGT